MFISYFRHFDQDRAIAQCTNWQLYVDRDEDFSPVLVLEMDGTKEVLLDTDGFWQGYQAYRVFRDFSCKGYFDIEERCYHAFDEIVSKVYHMINDAVTLINLGDIQEEVVLGMHSEIEARAEKYPEKI